MDLAAQKHDAQFLAKRGVNFAARVVQFVSKTAEGSKITDVDEKALDDIFKSGGRHEVGRHLLDHQPLLGRLGEDAEELGRDRPRHDQSRRAAVFRADDAEGIQGVAEGALRDGRTPTPA